MNFFTPSCFHRTLRTSQSFSPNLTHPVKNCTHVKNQHFASQNPFHLPPTKSDDHIFIPSFDFFHSFSHFVPSSQISDCPTTMPKQKVLFFCRQCFFESGETFTFLGTVSASGECTSGGLASHLACNSGKSCHKHHDFHDLFDHRLSRLKFAKHQPCPAKRSHTASEIGVSHRQHSPSETSLNTGDMARSANLHLSLNSQVLCNVLRPQASGMVIRAALSEKSKNQLSDISSHAPHSNSSNDEFSDNDSANEHFSTGESVLSVHDDSVTNEPADDTNTTFVDNDVALGQCFIKVPPIDAPIFQALPSHLATEIELLNILQNNHVPMILFKQIFDWHLCCLSDVKRNNSNSTFSVQRTSARSGETMLNEIPKHIPKINHNFKPTHINWLPDNKFVEICVRDFQDALFSLLTDPMLVKEENISLPNPRSPFISHNPQRNRDSPMTELHHGQWWTESWDKLCTSPDEILVPVIFCMDGISLDVNG